MRKARADVRSCDRGGVERDFVARCDFVAGTGRSGELGIAATGIKGVFLHFPRLQGSSSKILAQEDVQAVVDSAEGLVANEDYSVKTFEDHADLSCGVPAMVAVCTSVIIGGAAILCD